ncbi:formate dehydrogenase accessory sulfurtransferase FdhD, partial [Amaricoccus sp.]
GCGLCGIDSLEQAMRPLPRVADGSLCLSRTEVSGATEALRPRQALHAKTRATHAAGFLVPGQGIVLVREDVGRHNALDKLIGALMRSGFDSASGVAVMTSRLSVELVQKCAMSGIPGLVALSAPTARAVHLAEEAGVTLVAFARGGGFDIYSHAHRIADEVTNVA